MHTTGWYTKQVMNTFKIDPKGNITIIQPEPSGGKVSIPEIDMIADYPKATGLEISGLNDETFTYLITTYAKQFKSIQFWKCPRVSDLSPLETLSGIEKISYYWNQRAEKMWDTSKNMVLHDIGTMSFNRMHDLSGFANSKTLKSIWIEGDTFAGSKMRIDSLDPVFSVGSLESLTLAHIIPEQYSIGLLLSCTNLRVLQLAPNLFTKEEYALLAARFEGSVQAEVFKGLTPSITPWVKCVGKRMPVLNSEKDADKIRAYQAEFRKLIEHYKAEMEQ